MRDIVKYYSDLGYDMKLNNRLDTSLRRIEFFEGEDPRLDILYKDEVIGTITYLKEDFKEWELDGDFISFCKMNLREKRFKKLLDKNGR